MKNPSASSLRSNPLFETLEEDVLESMNDLVDPITLDKGEVLFEEGQSGEDFYTINDGLLKISIEDPQSGREKILALPGPDEIVGEMAVFGNQERSGKAIAIHDTRLFRITRDNFLELLQEYPQIGLNLIQILSKRLFMSDEEIETVTFQTIPGRLAAQLLKMGNQFGESTEEGLDIQIKLTHQQVSDLVGTNRETITRYLNKFENNGSIKIENKQITILDPESLEAWM